MFKRLEKITTLEKFNKLKNINVLIIGIGGVGGYALECLVRSGVENITIVDNDTVALSNLNRQIIALQKTINMPKTTVAKARALDINPQVKITEIQEFITKDNIESLNIKSYDYIIDACDTITTKLLLIKQAIDSNIKIISCMGTGNRFDASKVEITTINKTYNDPLAKVIRNLLKENNIKKKIPVVWTNELPIKIKDRTPGSCVTVPMAAGSCLATYIIKEILAK